MLINNGYVNLKGIKFDDLLMYKKKIINEIEIMGWKEFRNLKV